MERFEAGREHDAEQDGARGPGRDADSAPPRPCERLAADAGGGTEWPEAAWSPPGGGTLEERVELFADPLAEAELRREMRLSELWGQCKGESFTVDEFFELSTLITEVEAIRGALCTECAMLDRPNASAHWALGSTFLCRAHLRFHLGHARIDGEGSSPRT